MSTPKTARLFPPERSLSSAPRWSLMTVECWGTYTSKNYRDFRRRVDAVAFAARRGIRLETP